MKERRNSSQMKSPWMNNSLCFRALREGGGGTPETRKIQSTHRGFWKFNENKRWTLWTYLCSCVCPVKSSWYRNLWKIPPVPSTNGYRLTSRGIKYGMVQLSSLGQNRLYVIPRWSDTCYALSECNSFVDFHHFLPSLLIICFQFRHTILTDTVCLNRRVHKKIKNTPLPPKKIHLKKN
jgi:hypothetical protein